MKSALSEIIKYGVISDKKLFVFLEHNYAKVLRREAQALSHVVTSSARIKARVVEKDEFDRKGLRAILNYGHTVGHAVEAASSYSGRYDHGEAVAVGMVVAAKLAEKLNILSARDALRIESLIAKCGLPTKIRGLKLSVIRKALAHDKKFVNGKTRMILPTGIGRVRIVDNIPERIIKEEIKKSIKG